ncbi:MAG TPA: hypothetical protein EYN66_01220, partial [Myxococcales bacterium]|nr:hypothetical protein [Myxococcales bacterium]
SEKGIVKGSLRTQRDDINLSDVASQWGGGGHPKASGFGMSGALKPVMALETKAAGLTKKAHEVALQASDVPDEEAFEEILSMARRGTVTLRARLKNRPVGSGSAEAIATLQTNKGPLRLKVLAPFVSNEDKKNAVKFTTPRGRSFEIPLVRFPQHHQVVAALTTFGIVRKTKRMNLAVNKGDLSGFYVHYSAKTYKLDLVSKRLGAVAVNSAGLQLSAPVENSHTTSVSVQPIISSACDFVVSPSEPIGTVFYGSRFKPFYAEDINEISKVIPFDPETHEVGTRLPLISPDPIVSPENEQQLKKQKRGKKRR